MAKKQDFDLIFLKSSNLRMKLRDISKLLRKSSQRLKYAVEMLENNEIIALPHCIFDYSYMGLLLFRVYFKGGYISEKDKSDIISKLEQNPCIVSIYELIGEFDLAIELMAPNPSRFNKELKKVISENPTLDKYNIILNLVTIIHPRLYLTKKNHLLNQVRQSITIGGDREVHDFSAKELSVISIIAKKPDIRFTQLAKETDMNVKTATSIMKELQERKFIRGFRYLVNVSKLKIYKYRLFLKLHNINPEREEQLKKFCLQTDEIIRVNKTVGDWDVEIDIESRKKVKIRFLIVKLRQEFKELIANFNLIEVFQYHKISYLPDYITSTSI